MLTKDSYKARIDQIDALVRAEQIARDIDNEHTVATLVEMRKRLTTKLAVDLAELATANAGIKERDYYARDVWVALGQCAHHVGTNPYLCLTRLAWEVDKLAEPAVPTIAELAGAAEVAEVAARLADTSI